MSNTKILSYNQLVQIFRKFATDHYFINEFGHGPTSEIGTKNINFPLMWMTHRNSSNINTQNRTNILEMSLTFIIVDRISNLLNTDEAGENSHNGQEVLSDTLQTCQDLVSYLLTEMNQYGVLLHPSVTIQPVYDALPDRVNGWTVDLNIKITHYNCILPMDI